MDDKLLPHESDKEFPTETPRTSESVKLEPSSSVDGVGWSPRPRCATDSSVQENNKLKSSKGKDSNRPLTAKSKGELTEGIRKSQSQVARTNSATGPQVPGNTISRPKTPKSTGVVRPKTPAPKKQILSASRPKTPAPNSTRSKATELKTQRSKTPALRPKTAGSTAHKTSGGQLWSSAATRPKTPGPERPNAAKLD